MSAPFPPCVILIARPRALKNESFISWIVRYCPPLNNRSYVRSILSVTRSIRSHNNPTSARSTEKKEQHEQNREIEQMLCKIFVFPQLNMHISKLREPHEQHVVQST